MLKATICSTFPKEFFYFSKVLFLFFGYSEMFFYLGSISSTFYVQLLRTQIPNVQKRQSSQQCHLGLSGPTSVKAARKTLVKLTQGLFCCLLLSIFATALYALFAFNTFRKSFSQLHGNLVMKHFMLMYLCCATMFQVCL